ncbi:MAG: hypothetical protein ABIN48_13190, partial [Ginsengibacter sp.]
MNVRFFFTLIFLSLFGGLNAQDLLRNVDKYSNGYQEERVYIHFDKSAYSPGETIWFKAYLMKAIFPEMESKTLYIDFSDENGNLLSHSSSPIIEGSTYSQFEISPEYKGEFLYIKAYTKWMLNFDSAFLYHKEIKILNKKAIESTKKEKRNQLSFFPEGGNIIEGIVNKVAFKMNDPFGRPLLGKGVILDNKGKIVDSLRVMHDGMGIFYLKPDPGESYTARWKSEDDQERVIPLPAVLKSGVGIQIGFVDEKRSFKISSATYGDDKEIHVLGTMYSQQVFQFSKTLKEGHMQGIIPTADLPSGILTITVFDKTWKPLAERITYIDNEEYTFHPEISVQHWGLNKRAKNELLITVPDDLISDLSIAVTDGGIAVDSSENIISHLKLTSDLKGKINNPSYYFRNNHDSTIKNRDLLMLTHGWRKFNWENLSSGIMPEILYPKDTSYLTVSGRIYGATPVQLRDAGSIVLLFSQNNQGNNIVSVPIKSDGTFMDPNLIVFDTANIYYQLPKGKGIGGATVQFMQERLPPLSNNMKATGDFYNYNTDTTGHARQFNLSDIINQEEAFAKAKILETVTIHRKTKSPVELLDEKYASGMFQGGDGYQFDLLNDPFSASSLNIFSYLQGKVA